MFKQGLRSTLFLVCIAVATNVSSQGFRLPSGESLEDPTLPAGQVRSTQEKAVTKNFQLSYIVNSAQRRYAIINGQQVYEGGRVEGALVKKISAKSVLLVDRGRTRTLSVNAVSVKKNY